MTTYIDIEPTWEDLCRAASTGHLNAKELMPACKIADFVRQAQKKGAKTLTITFIEGGQIEIDDGLDTESTNV